MDTVKRILTKLGLESIAEMDVNESYTIQVEGFEDLTIEKVGSQLLSVAHHYTLHALAAGRTRELITA